MQNNDKIKNIVIDNIPLVADCYRYYSFKILLRECMSRILTCKSKYKCK